VADAAIPDGAACVQVVEHGSLSCYLRLALQGGIARRRKVVGECHALESSKAGVHEIFISPALDQPLEVAGTVCHEMAHVAAGIKAGHGQGYRKVCKSVDLTKGSPTNASPGPVLTERLHRIVESLGDYPHMALVPVVKLVKRPKTAVTLACLNCGCRVRISLKWLDEVGFSHVWLWWVDGIRRRG
jgi:hypothetical protein